MAAKHIANLSKLPKRKITVDDILDRSDLVNCLDKIKERRDITGVYVLYRTKDDAIGCSYSNMPVKDRIYALNLALHKEVANEITD